MATSPTPALPIAANHTRFTEIVQFVLAYARKMGASDAVAEASESMGLSVSVRKNDIETIERTHDRSLDVTVYAGKRRGGASTSDFSEAALCDTVQAAWHIARHTAEDPMAGLPEVDMLAFEYPDLKLHSPWPITTDAAAQLALRAEAAARATDKCITNCDGTTLSTYEGQFVMGNSRDFLGGYPYSRHSLSVAPIADAGHGMQRDYWYTSARAYQDLANPKAVGHYAAQRALARLNARRIPTGQFPVLFEAPLAVGLLGAFTQAVSGGALYRKASFLLDSLGQSVFATHINIAEDPTVIGGMGSAPFDDEGVRTTARSVVEQGVLQGYFLSTYTSRKLGMKTTGNAGGSHNLVLTSSLTERGDDLPAMLRKLGTGLFVTELMGQGVNYVTGDYSRGAFGYWVEGGMIQHAVEEITIAGNLNDMFRQIVAVGADSITRGTKTTGSILIENLAIAGV
jgi:PmbA protein